MHGWNKAKHISKCLELAILLEVSADKPGNVNRRNGFEHTRYEHFLASAVALSPSFEIAAERGIAVSREDLGVENIEIGLIIRDCAVNVSAWQHGGNTLLGTAILLSPIAVAAGMTSDKEQAFDIQRLRENLKIVVKSTSPEDAVNVYEAIRTAKPAGLGEVPEFDVNDLSSTDMILREKKSLFQIFKIAEKYDSICSEWINGYPITFDVAYPSLIEQIRKNKDLNMAIIHTFLLVLSEYPDTFIARKTSPDRAQEISFKAKKVLDLGGPATAIGKQSLNRLDRELRKASNTLNPGTTADIIAASLALCILEGYRP